MAVNEEDINALTSELQKFRENFGGMLDDTRKSRVTLEGIEKAIKEQSAAQAKARDEEDDIITYEGNDTDDMKKTLDAHMKLVEGLKSEKEEAEQADVEAKNTKNTAEMLRNQQKTSANQMKTNEYLRLLTDLTNENNTRTRNRDQETKSLLGKSMGMIGKGYGVAENYFGRTGAKGSQIGGGIGEMMGGARELVSIFKKGSDFFTQRGSRKRQSTIGKLVKDINKDKALIAAERNRLDELKKSGGSQSDIDALQASIKSRADRIRGKSKSFGEYTAREYMHQRGRTDKDYRKMSKYERELLIEHSAKNIAASATSDINGKITAASKRKSSDDQQLTSRRRKNELLSEAQGMSREDAYASMRGSKSTGIGGMLGGFAGGLAGLLKPKGADTSTPDRGMRLQSKSLMNTPIVPAKNPRTYGQYIAGIYQELDELNDTLGGGKGKTGKVATGEGGGGGIFSGIMGAVLGGLGSMVMGKMGKLGRFLMKPFSKLGGKAFSKLGGKGLLKGGFKGAEKGILKGGLKGAEKLGGKEALKLGDKGALKMGGKEATKIGSKGLAKGVAKKIPVLGLIAGLGFGIDRLMDGDYLGAGGEVLSGLVSLLPVLGTAASIGIDATLVARDIKNANGAGDEEEQSLNDFERSIKSSRTDVRQKDVERTRPTFKTMTTASVVEGAVGRDQLNAMQIQARLIAMEMSKLYKSDEYVLSQRQSAKNQATYMKNTMVG